MADNKEVKEEAVEPSKSVQSKKDVQKESKDNKKQKKAKENKTGAVSRTFSELKKVSWPTFKNVVKQTSVVIVVTLVFLVVILGLDKLCSWLMGLIC